MSGEGVNNAQQEQQQFGFGQQPSNRHHHHHHPSAAAPRGGFYFDHRVEATTAAFGNNNNAPTAVLRNSPGMFIPSPAAGAIINNNNGSASTSNLQHDINNANQHGITTPVFRFGSSATGAAAAAPTSAAGTNNASAAVQVRASPIMFFPSPAAGAIINNGSVTSTNPHNMNNPNHPPNAAVGGFFFGRPMTEASTAFPPPASTLHASAGNTNVGGFSFGGLQPSPQQPSPLSFGISTATESRGVAATHHQPIRNQNSHRLVTFGPSTTTSSSAPGTSAVHGSGDGRNASHGVPNHASLMNQGSRGGEGQFGVARTVHNFNQEVSLPPNLQQNSAGFFHLAPPTTTTTGVAPETGGNLEPGITQNGRAFSFGIVPTSNAGHVMEPAYQQGALVPRMSTQNTGSFVFGAASPSSSRHRMGNTTDSVSNWNNDASFRVGRSSQESSGQNQVSRPGGFGFGSSTAPAPLRSTTPSILRTSLYTTGSNSTTVSHSPLGRSSQQSSGRGSTQQDPPGRVGDSSSASVSPSSTLREALMDPNFRRLVETHANRRHTTASRSRTSGYDAVAPPPPRRRSSSRKVVEGPPRTDLCHDMQTKEEGDDGSSKQEEQPCCIICLDNAQNCIAWPCAHLAFCVQCSRELCFGKDGNETKYHGQVKCPACREDVHVMKRTKPQ